MAPRPALMSLLLLGIACAIPRGAVAWECGLYPGGNGVLAHDGEHTTKWKRKDDYASDRAEIIKLAKTMDIKSWPSKKNWLDDSLSFCEYVEFTMATQ